MFTYAVNGDKERGGIQCGKRLHVYHSTGTQKLHFCVYMEHSAHPPTQVFLFIEL